MGAAKFLLIFLFLPLLTQAQVMRAKPIAMVYKGPGACRGCPGAIGSVLKKIGFEVAYAGPGELTAQNFAKVALYVQPGSDSSTATLRALHPGEIQNLQRFISNGGKYLGLCGGAFLAGQWNRTGKMRAYGLVPMRVLPPETIEENAMLLPVNWMGSIRHIFHEAGPHMGVDPLPGAEVVARFVKTGRIAAMISPFGRGRVGLIGPHPEANESWYREDGLDPRFGFNFDLINDFVQRLYRLP